MNAGALHARVARVQRTSAWSIPQLSAAAETCMLPNGVGVGASYEARVSGTVRPGRSTGDQRLAAARSEVKLGVAAQRDRRPRHARCHQHARRIVRRDRARGCRLAPRLTGTGGIRSRDRRVCRRATGGRARRVAEDGRVKGERKKVARHVGAGALSVAALRGEGGGLETWGGSVARSVRARVRAVGSQSGGSWGGPAGWRGQGPMGRVPRSSRGGVGKCRGWAVCVSVCQP